MSNPQDVPIKLIRDRLKRIIADPASKPAQVLKATDCLIRMSNPIKRRRKAKGVPQPTVPSGQIGTLISKMEQ
jgi:hypothetical protein